MKVSISTYGCSLNHADSEALAGVLKESGNELTDESDSEVHVVNTCTVKGPTESKIKKELRELKAKGKKVVVAGCLSQTKYGREILDEFSAVGTNSIHKISEVVSATSKGQKLQLLESKQSNTRLKLPSVNSKELITIIPINEGCMSSCTFCHTKKARGNTVSYSVRDICDKIKSAVDNGSREVWLTSPDTMTWGLDIGSNITKLLEEVCKLRGGFKVRLGMGNPDYMKQFLPELIEVMKHDKMFKFLHIPIQSGSDSVLKRMARKYNREEIKNIVSKLREGIPSITVATDIIVGFPTESDQDFRDTIDLVNELRFDSINISKFWPRPETVAAKLKPLPSEVVKSRSKELRDVFQRISEENNRQWVGWEGTVLIDEEGKDCFIGRNFAYKQVILEKGSLGEEVRVKIADSGVFDLKGISKS